MMENDVNSENSSKIKNEEISDDDCMIVSDNDSDYDPGPRKKKPPAKGKQPAVKKPRTVKTATKRVKNENKIKKEAANPATPKKRKVPAKETKTAAKKIKLEDNIKNEESGSSINMDPSNSTNYEASSVKRNDEPDTGCTKDISKIVENAKRLCEPWQDEVVVAEVMDIPIHVAKNVILLLEQECTIPFIVRYRKEMTGGLSAEKLRDIQTSYDEVKLVHKKVDNILKTVKSEKFDESAATAMLSAKTLEEVEFLYAPFKPGSKKTLAERSKQLGLEPLAMELMESKISLSAVNFSLYIKQQKGLQNKQEILSGIQHIIADAISKDRRVLDFNRHMSNHHYIRLMCSKSASAEKEDRQAHVVGKTTDNFKYENYFNFNNTIMNIAHHQVMAINRGEKNKVLSVKLQIPFDVKRKISDFIWSTFFKKKFLDPETLKFLKDCAQDAYDRLIEPHMCRQIRSDLTKKAEKESIAMFCLNVHKLLLMPPVRGKAVIGVDPGFSHGCKIAAVSSKGEVLKTDVIYPHSKNKNKSDVTDGVKLKILIETYGAEIVAIGNGTACRETELWLSNLIAIKFFHPFEVKYCIVNESGVSIYSVTKEAEAELPNMDPNVRSAVAIARRLQDPLLEFVKIEPKHLGVGMYQHDVPETQLKKALDGVVEECVSFVGVDLNVCPEFLLRKISGLSSAKAKNIVEWRTQHGSFINRQQLLEVKGLGPKSYEQCAGFVKILPETCCSGSNKVQVAKGTKKTNFVVHMVNPLDRTIVHPESYDVAEKFLKELKANPEDVGMQTLVDKVNSYMQFRCIDDVAKTFNVAVPVMQLIIDAFKQLLDYDIRGEFDKPLFKTSVRKYADLAPGQELTGRIMNVTGFGAFVDVGVERNGLIHTSKMRGQTVGLGDKVTVKVISIDFDKKRLQLELLKK